MEVRVSYFRRGTVEFKSAYMSGFSVPRSEDAQVGQRRMCYFLSETEPARTVTINWSPILIPARCNGSCGIFTA